MSESIKAVLGVILAACIPTTMFAWLPSVDGEISSIAWGVRIGAPILALLCLAIILWAQTRRDKVPNFLLNFSRSYFERDGFCFLVAPEVVDGECCMRIYYQNRFDRRCIGRILVRASSGIAAGRPAIPEITVGVSCEPAEFGTLLIPWDIPLVFQGTAVPFSVYAGVSYPDGRGKLLIFRDGMRVGAVGMDFWREGLQITAALGGGLVVSRPARLTLMLPPGSPAHGSRKGESVTTIWKLGDPLPSGGG